MSESFAEKIKQIFEAYRKRRAWCAPTISMAEKDVLKILEDYTVIEKQKLQELLDEMPIDEIKTDNVYLLEWKKKFAEVFRA